MMSEWKEEVLGNCIETNRKSIGKGYPYTDVLYLDTGSITENRIDKLQEFHISKAPSRAKRLVEEGDIIYSSVRPNQLHYGFIKKPKDNLVVSTGFVVISCDKEKIQPKYLFYYLSSDNSTEYLHSIAEASTSAYPSLKPSDIEALDIYLPPLPEQQAIAEVLSSLDDKIDLLHCQNKTLEQMAETLFRQWFIEPSLNPSQGEGKEAQEDWEETTIGEVIETTSGGTPSRKKMEYYENGNIPWIKSKELNRGYLIDTEEKITGEGLKKSSAKILPANSILIAMYGATVGEYTVISKEMTCNQAICALMPNNNYPYTFLFVFIKLYQEELINMAVGSAQQNISQQLIKQIPIPVPNNKILEYHNEVEPFFEKTKNNIHQIRTLEKMRDTLLPKLMSGEVRVKIKKEKQ